MGRHCKVRDRRPRAPGLLRRSAVLVVLAASVAVAVFGGTWVLAPRWGLIGVGAALLIAETLAAAAVRRAVRRCLQPALPERRGASRDPSGDG